MSPIPITIITGFLGAGKTTLILNLIPQLPLDYKSKDVMPFSALTSHIDMDAFSFSDLNADIPNSRPSQE